MSTRIILIRHGETDYSSGKRYCGITDADLNDKGITQAQRLCQRLDREKIDKVYSSDSKRAFNFARIIFKDLSIESLPGLREINFGIFEGLGHEEILEKHPDVYAEWLKKPFDSAIPEGDSLVNFKKRVEGLFREIVSLNKGKTAAMVTHGGPIRIIIGSILDSKNIWDKMPGLASLSIVEFKNDTGKVLLFNDRGHLDG